MIVIVKQKQNSDEQSLNVLNEVLHTNHTATLIDGSMLPEMAKINIANQHIKEVKSELENGWDFFPEKKYKVPNTKRKIFEKKAF